MQTKQQDLEHQLALTAFLEFIEGRIDPVFLAREGQHFTYPNVQLAFQAFCTGRAGTVGKQLYASIKKSSKYHHQNEWAIQQGYGHPFPVCFQAALDGYVIKGGPGGNYRQDDVELYVMHEGEQYRVC